MSVEAVRARIAQIEALIQAPRPAPTANAGATTSTNSNGSGFSALLSDALASNGVADPTSLTPGASTAPVATGQTKTFLDTALAQKGKPYVYGATAALDDPNPKAFDCSELTKWAAARAGVTIPDGATAQFLYARDHGTTMSVDQALHTPGALLFHFGHEPRDLGDIPADGHVAISLGDGKHTIEARGHKYGTNVFEVDANRKQWLNFAATIPGMSN